MSTWPAWLSVKGASKLTSWFSPTFHCFNVLLEKNIKRQVSANTARFVRFASLETLLFSAPEGITNFGIALAGS